MLIINWLVTAEVIPTCPLFATENVEELPVMFNEPVTLCVSVKALPNVTPVPVTVNSVTLPLTTVN